MPSRMTERHNCGRAINFLKSDESLISSSFSLSRTYTHLNNYLMNFHTAFYKNRFLSVLDFIYGVFCRNCFTRAFAYTSRLKASTEKCQHLI